MEIDKDTKGLEDVFTNFDKFVDKNYNIVVNEIYARLNSKYGRPCTIPVMEYPTTQIYVGWMNKGFWKFKFVGQKLYEYSWNVPSIVFMNS